MKNYIFVLILLGCCHAAMFAETSVGVRDSRYVYAEYSLDRSWAFRIEHSLYSEKFGYQRIAGSAQYRFDIVSGLTGGVGIKGATTWNRNYQVIDGMAGLEYEYRRWHINTVIQPHYDSGLGYDFCWKVGASFRLVDPVSIVCSYTTIPEYRMSQNRIRGGFEFVYDKLIVSPELSFSVDDNTFMKNMRVLMSMKFTF